MAGNPNVHSMLVIGLGYEVLKAESLVERMSVFEKRVEYLNIQELGGAPGRPRP